MVAPRRDRIWVFEARLKHHGDAPPEEISTTTEEIRPEIEQAALTRNGHTEDFASIRWNGVVYHFTAKQRLIVSLLWSAHEKGLPCISVERLKDFAEVYSVANVFKNHPAWGTAIITGDYADLLRLAPPTE